MDINVCIRLKNLRKSFRLTQKELANQLGIARPTLSGYENMISQPDLETLRKYAEFFCVTTDYLLGLEDNPSQNDEFLEKLLIYGRKLNGFNRDIIIGTMASMIKEQEENTILQQRKKV